MELIKNENIEYLCNECGEPNCDDGHFDAEGNLLPSENYPKALCDAFNSIWAEGEYGYALYMCRICGAYYIVNCAEFGELDDEQYRSKEMRDAIISHAKLLEQFGRLHGSKIFFVDDCDSPFCQWELLVATPVEPCPQEWQLREVAHDMDNYLMFSAICPEEAGIEMDRKREFTVDTPLGRIHVYSKHDPVDCAADFPGIYVDFIPPYYGSEPILLAATEYDPYTNEVKTCVYGDGISDEPTHVENHYNLHSYMDELIARARKEQEHWKSAILMCTPEKIFNASAEIEMRSNILCTLEERHSLTNTEARKLLRYEMPIYEIMRHMPSDGSASTESILEVIRDMARKAACNA